MKGGFQINRDNKSSRARLRQVNIRMIAVALLCALMAPLPFGPHRAAMARQSEGIALGPFRIVPSLDLTYGHDDNVVLTHEERVESYFYLLSPSIRLELPTDRSVLSLAWAAEVGRYEDSEIDDYDDWFVELDWAWNPTTRHRFNAFAYWDEGHDRRGRGARQGDLALLPVAPDEWEKGTLGVSWVYGAPGARGRLMIDASVVDLEYTNNPEFTEFRDYRSDQLGASFFWRIRPKTRLGIGAEWVTFDYDPVGAGASVASLDSDASYYYVGVEWDATARTSGRIDFGVHEKDFDAASRQDYDDSFWRASIDWRPRSYSAFTLSASRKTQETDGFGDFVLRRDLGLEWNHTWSRGFSTTAEIGRGNERHEPMVRDEDYTRWGISGRWQFNPYLRLGVGWRRHDRDSSQDQFVYDRDVWMLTLQGSLQR